MHNQSKTNQELIEEISLLKKRIRDLEVSEAEHRQELEKLRENELKYSKLVETTHDLIYIADKNGFLTYMNPVLIKTLGYGREEWEGQPFTKIIAPECMELAKNIFKRAMKGEPIPLYEIEMIRKDGSRIAVEVNVTTLYDRDGKPVGRYGIGRDITDRKQSEEALRRSEAMLNSVFKAAPIGLCIMKNRVFQNVNKAWYESLGYSETEIIGHTPRLLYDSEDEYERVGRALFCDLAVTGMNSVQTKHRRKDGFVLDVVLTAVPLPAEAASSDTAIVTVQDITDRRQAEDALRRSESLYRAIFENTGNATILLSEEKKIILANTEFEKMSGYAKEEIEGKKSWTEFVVQEDLDRLLEYHRVRRIDEKAVPRKYECRFIDRYGTIKEMALSVDMIPGTKRSIASLHDLTERKQ